MKIRILGGGWYGCHIATALLASGHEVELHETRDQIFGGASGSIPARLHLGFHYPRSRLTRAACLDHSEEFLARYGHLTSGVPINLYAIAANDSLVDFEQYLRTLRGEVEFVTVQDPGEFGLRNVEGAVLTGERHILTHRARHHFESALLGRIRTGCAPAQEIDDRAWDWTIDCTFCANHSAGVDRYEPCLVPLLHGHTEKAVTIMDGPFPSLYPWDELEGLCSLSSALWTPFAKDIRSWQEARDLLDRIPDSEVRERTRCMVESMATFFPAIHEFEVVDHLLSIRAMPRSGADARLVDVVKVGDRALRIRAGKIDAVIHAERLVREFVK